MKTFVILHGVGGHAGIHWQRWLKSELESAGYRILMPDLPDADHPSRKAWLNLVTKLLKDIELANLVIIGHSLGVATALDFIESSQVKIDGLVSVSGFAKDYGSELNSYFMKEKPINFRSVLENLTWAEVVYGDNDPYVGQEILRDLAGELRVEPHIISHGGHLNSDAGYNKFPELLEIIEQKVSYN